MNDPDFRFQPLRESHLPLMADWLRRDHLQKWWRAGPVSIDDVRKKYMPRIIDDADARPFLAHFEGELVGFIQYYWASAGDPDYWPEKPDPGVIGIDLFLANEKQLNKGIGTGMVRAFVTWIKKKADITSIWIDPHPENLRAIRCYEKAGFKKKGPMTNPDGPALWMELGRDGL